MRGSARFGIVLIVLFGLAGRAGAGGNPVGQLAVANPSSAQARPALLAAEARADDPELRSEAFLIVDQRSGRVLLERNAARVAPIASLTKLMTAMVVLDSKQSLSETLQVSYQDVDTLRKSRSRLPVGARLSRQELLRLALMASENRAASALARNHPGGMRAFVQAMNAKARALGLQRTRFAESTGLSAGNVSTPRDLARLVQAAASYPLIRNFSTDSEHAVTINGRVREFRNTNNLVRDPQWDIGLSKTGYIKEAGRCLVMQAWVQERPLLIVLLDSFGRYTRTADARRLRNWLAEHPWKRALAAQQASAG
ncbi:MAG: D-alanyl-D-alanine endopeptidase [Rhodocyclaceae bacterium]|nr:D-alanyl-D-alanine endopeptidase [Rhodocyclaceae bacterium]